MAVKANERLWHVFLLTSGRPFQGSDAVFDGLPGAPAPGYSRWPLRGQQLKGLQLQVNSYRANYYRANNYGAHYYRANYYGANNYGASSP